jgi:quinate/shikimate dehydrogenase (NAD+)
MNLRAEADESAKGAVRPNLRAGLLGRGIGASRTPRMHTAEGARLGLSYEYRLFDFDRLGLADSDLPSVLTEARRDGFAGLNVTHPFKERVIAHLDVLSTDAAAIGAVNTVVFDGGHAVGHNTDCWGFAESFRRGLNAPRLSEVVLIGAGGAGMAVGRALLELQTEHLTIVDDAEGKSKRLAEILGAAFGREHVSSDADRETALTHANGLVNATPVGMAKYPGMPVERTWLRPDIWIADVIYFPAETELLCTARRIGCQILPGAGMAIFQAVKAFELITGVAPDADQMARHFWQN